MQLSVSGYNIEFGSAPDILKEYLKDKNYSSISVLVDENTRKQCLPLIQDVVTSANILEIASGEQNKTLTTCEFIWNGLLKGESDRHSLLINLGGGVIGDMGGFAASTYMRGIDFIQIPTTLLSQVDASVGGKLGVDFKGLKNFIGLFRNPEEVIIDEQFLNTLPADELISGYAEMIKHALIKDVATWKRFEDASHWKENLTNEELRSSVEIKRNVVINDPFENGLRKILNFGHTLGHAIETYSFQTQQPLLHGYAIALGMIGEAYLSTKMLGLSTDSLQRIKRYILSIYKVDTSFYHNKAAIVSNMKHDKKNKSGKVLFSLLRGLGECSYDIEVGTALIEESLEYTLFS